jgi:ribosome-binding factor A
VVPELTFFVDDTNEYVERMDHLFDKIAKEPRQKDEDSE